MNELESREFKLCLLWLELCKKEFPNDRPARLRRYGDPRKSLLFRHCYKLIQETKGLIKPEEYKLYILAQLRNMGKLEVDGIHADLQPSILTGPAAWKRWKIWKYKYDKRMRQTIPDVQTIDMVTSPMIVIQQLENTKKFLTNEVGILNQKTIKMLVKMGKFKEWLQIEKVSPYYIILSPFVAASVENINTEFDKDFGIYKQSISSEVKDKFRELFLNEFSI